MIKIREARYGDIEELSNLVFNFRNEHSQIIRGEAKSKIDLVKEEVDNHIQRVDTGYFIALDSKDQLVGFRRWELHDGFYFTRELYVIPAMRRKGIAKVLIKHFEKWLIGKGQDIACISCTPHNIAMIMLARSEGYDILNMIEMRKNLTTNPKQPRAEMKALEMRWKVL